MALAAAMASADRAIDTVVQNGLSNGNFIQNGAVPSSTHVHARAKWVLREDANGAYLCADLTDSIVWMARVDVDTAARAAIANDDKLAIDLAVMVAMGRRAAWRYFNLSAGQLDGSECVALAHGVPASVIHADHEAAIADAIAKWSIMATRFPGLAWYNAISFEGHNHHHLPAVTGKLASTTITLLGMEQFFTDNQASGAETVIMHDMFHPLSSGFLAILARNSAYAAALSALKFENLLKRVPVKAPDCGLALNYDALIRKARTFAYTSADLPKELNAPAPLLAAVAEYAATVDPVAQARTIAKLRAMTPYLAEPSAYVVGFMLGRERLAREDLDLTLTQVARTNTILGAPAYKTAAATHPGLFNLGCTRGAKKPAKSVAAAAQKHATAILSHRIGMVTFASELQAAINGPPGTPLPTAPPEPVMGDQGTIGRVISAVTFGYA